MKFTFIFLILFSLFACNASKKSQNSNALSLMEQHKTIAILPAYVKLLVPENQEKNIARDELNEAQMKLSFIIQNETYKWVQKNKYSVAIQDVKVSNRTLFEKGLSYDAFKTLTTDTLAKILGVDAVIVCITDLTKVRYKSVDVFLNFTSPLAAIASVGWSGMSIANPQINEIDDIDLYFRIVDGSTNSKLWETTYKSGKNNNIVLEKFYRNSIRNFAKILPYHK